MARLLAFIMHLFQNVCSIGGHGALIHSTWTLAQTGAYSIVQTVGSSLGHGANSQFGHDLPTELPSSQSLASELQAVHSPLLSGLVVSLSFSSKHFGSLGVSQYISVQASGCPSLTLQVLHPSK